MIQDQLAACGLEGCRGAILIDGSPAVLTEKALKNHEGILTSKGALAVETGKYTGRSPEDRFIVDTEGVHDQIAWGSVNKPFSVENYEKVKRAVCDYLSVRDIYIVHAMAGADTRWCRKFFIVCERASQALFSRQLLVRPSKRQLADFEPQDFSVLVAPGLKLNPEVHGTHSEAAVLINFDEKIVLIAGTQYNGEIKKSIFSVMNYLMPVEEDVLPMHSSANMDPVTGETAVFFGLSGTGKTTLSADPQRMLIGDDEHGWSEGSVFNFEGGCYAKAIRISAATEPEIYRAIRFGSILENVVVDHVTRKPDYFDGTVTENTRVAYPIDYIENAQVLGQGRYPNVIIFLTADAFGGRAPADLEARHQRRHVPLPVGLHEQGRRHRARRDRAAAHVLDPVRRAVHAAVAASLRAHVRREAAGRRHPRLPHQHRLDRRRLRHRFQNETEIHELNYLFWECTWRCNLSCRHCGSDCKSETRVADMPFADFLRAIEPLEHRYPRDTVIIAITGGEPLLRDDLADCGHALRQHAPHGLGCPRRHERVERLRARRDLQRGCPDPHRRRERSGAPATRDLDRQGRLRRVRSPRREDVRGQRRREVPGHGPRGACRRPRRLGRNPAPRAAKSVSPADPPRAGGSFARRAAERGGARESAAGRGGARREGVAAGEGQAPLANATSVAQLLPLGEGARRVLDCDAVRACRCHIVSSIAVQAATSC